MINRENLKIKFNRNNKNEIYNNYNHKLNYKLNHEI